MKTPPDTVAPYRRTPAFTAATMPAALRRGHATAADTWGRIVVLRRWLRYEILEPYEDHALAPGGDGIVEPAVPHRVTPSADAEFYVEFCRAGDP